VLIRKTTAKREGTKHWTGLLEWTTGLEYWTDIFLVFAHFVVG